MASVGRLPTGPAVAEWPLGLGRRERRAALARVLLLGGGGAAVAYAGYRLYRSDAATAWCEQARRLRAAIAAYAEAFGTGAETLAMLAADLRAFLASDSTDLPPSLRQIARLMQTPEVANTTSATVAALIRGVTASSSAPGGGTAYTPTNGSAAAAGSSAGSGAASTHKPALDRALDALLSERGQNLVSVAVSLGARNLVAGYCDAQHRLAASDAAAAAAARAAAVLSGGVLPPLSPPQPDLTNRLLDFLASPRGQQVAVLAVTAFVTGGMRAYLDQTLDLNFYEDLFSAMAKPEHLDAAKAIVGVFARSVVGTYLAGPDSAGAAAGAQAPGVAADTAAAGQARVAPRAQLRLSASIHELLGATAGHQQQEADEGEGGAPFEPGSPCASSASGQWQQRQQHVQQQEAEPAVAGVASVAEATTPAGSDVDSDVLLHSEAAGAAAVAVKGPCCDSAHSQDSSWAVRTPPATAGALQGAATPALPQLRRVRQQSQPAGGAGASGGMQREGSGNLEWISAVSKEWLNVAQHPQGRTVMVELAGAAAKEAAAGVSAALADRFRLEWLLLAAFAMLMLAWLAQRMLGVLLG